MGREQILKWRVEFSKSEGGKDFGIPVAPLLLEGVVAMPIESMGHLCFLKTTHFKPLSNPGFDNWFRDQCAAAGVPQCTAHWLPKAMIRRTTELHFGNQSLKSISGDHGDAAVVTYTRAVDQRRMATDAITALAAWESARLEPANG